MNVQLIKTESLIGSGLQYSKIDINADYRAKWNIHENDFICLTRNGELVGTTLYRIGGMGDSKPNPNGYFMLLKHVEAFYDKSILDSQKKRGAKVDPKYLESKWCILDKNGNEKYVQDSFRSPYLVKNSCIFSVDSKYYNIETKEFYCDTSKSIESEDYLFLENRYDKDKSRRGVMMINKLDGTWKLFQ